jgi:peptidoglycan hydrolase-like protein with peptidoglycan-binding domain
MERGENMIVHASIDENGKTSGGKAGDQTGKEVCTRSFYSKPWNVMLRYKDSTIAAKAVEIAVKLANSNLIGYDQNQRNTLYIQLKKYNFDVDKYIKSGVKTETDCSGFIYAVFCCLIAAMRQDGNAPTTSTMRTFYKKYGFTVYTDSKYLTSDAYLKKGDILIKEGSHTVMNISTGSKVSTSTASTTTTTSGTSTTTTTYSKTQFIKDVQAALGATVDGVAGSKTLGKTVTVSAKINAKHAVVKPLQKYLNSLGYNVGTADGVAGSKFTSGVIAYQKANGCTADGEITKSGKTWKKLLGLA